jgi:hypothetical protein
LWSASQRYLTQGIDMLSVGRYGDAQSTLQRAKRFLVVFIDITGILGPLHHDNSLRSELPMANQINIQPPISQGPRDQVIQEIVDAIRNQLTEEFPDPDEILSDNVITVNNDRA